MPGSDYTWSVLRQPRRTCFALDTQGFMDTFLTVVLLALGGYALKSKSERRRMALLARHLGEFDIEKMMGSLNEGYLRALGESDHLRRDAIWHVLLTTETRLSEQLQQLAAGFAKLPALPTRVSRLPWPLSVASLSLAPLLPGVLARTSFDMRELLALHAHAIGAAARNEQGLSPRDKAFKISAELFLMQHSCHWFCRSRGIASARLQVRHQNSYAKVLDSVAPATRRAYLALVGA